MQGTPFPAKGCSEAFCLAKRAVSPSQRNLSGMPLRGDEN
jgi:hypothetical protein